MIKPKGLGRGLEALLGEDRPPAPAPIERVERSPRTLPLGLMQAGRYQPRTRMDETSLQELASSIRSHGLMQPIVVRPLPLRLKPFPLLAYWHESRDTDRAHQWVRERIAALVRSSAGIADA